MTFKNILVFKKKVTFIHPSENDYHKNKYIMNPNNAAKKKKKSP